MPDARLSDRLRPLCTAALAAALAAALVLPGPSIAAEATGRVAVAPQYDTTHVYVAPVEVDAFAQSFLATFGGTSTSQVQVTVTPTPSRSSSQLLQTPVGTVSLFGFTTPIPYPFGRERNGFLVQDLEAAVKAARRAGALVVVEPFDDPIGRDAVIQWPGGINLQLYWHTKAPDYPALQTIPEQRAYVPSGAADAFVKRFVAFSRGKVVNDQRAAPGIEVGKPGTTYRRIRIESDFGKMVVIVTDGHLPYPYGHEVTAYEVADLPATLAKARGAAVEVLDGPYAADGRDIAMVRFPGGYVAGIHALRQ